MSYAVLLAEAAKAELAVIKRSGDKVTLRKIVNMLAELQEHPRTGTGQVEHLKHSMSLKKPGRAALIYTIA